MASSNQTPDVLFSPIAANADASDINTIPQTYDPTNYGYAAQNVGFPTECRLPVLNSDGTLGQGRAPRMQDWNGLLKLVSSHNFFLQNGGSYTFNPTVSSNIGGYPKNAVLWYFPENEDPFPVYSLINDNTYNFVDDPTLIDDEHWKKLSFGGGGGEIGDMGFAPLGIDESLNLRRYLNGQVISQLLSPAFTAKVKAAIALHPSLGTTEANWQSEKTLSKLGQCGKFVIDDENQTIRLPAVVNAQSLLTLSTLGTIKDESLPNITGVIRGGNLDVVNTQWFNCEGAFTPIDQRNAGVASSAGGKIGYNALFFSASDSSTTYQNNAPVQQEAIQYPYYIQIATGIEETLPAIREYEINTPFFFGQSMYSENAPYNASWLASNGQYNASTLYPDFWTQLTGVELNNSLNVGDTIEISGKTYVKRGLPVVLSTGTITDYDFVVNQNDQTFRLPLLNGEEDLQTTSYDELTLRESGSTYTAPANGFFYLNKIAGSDFYYTQIETVKNGDMFRRIFVSEYQTSPCTFLYPVKKGEVVRITYNATGATNAFRFFYAKGNGTLYYYVGDTVQDASLINAGAVLGQLSNKADIDASNFNADGKSLLSGLGMPSTKYTDLTLLASGQTYTAPANGKFALYKIHSGTSGKPQYATFRNETTGLTSIKDEAYNENHLTNEIEAKKGEVVSLGYTLTGSTTYFRFYYAEGEK